MIQHLVKLLAERVLNEPVILRSADMFLTIGEGFSIYMDVEVVKYGEQRYICQAQPQLQLQL